MRPMSLFTRGTGHRPISIATSPPVRRDSGEEAPADVVRLTNGLSVLTIAMNLRWDVLAWNPLDSAIYRDYGKMPAGERNLLEILLARPVQHLTPAGLAIAQVLASSSTSGELTA